jgi:hypothetical protein
MNTNERIVNILLERKVNSFLERTDEGIIGGGLRGLYQGVKKSFNKDYNPEVGKQANMEKQGIGHTAAQHTGRLAGRALGGAIKTAGAAIKGGARGVYQGIKKHANPGYNPEAHKQANMERQGVVGAGAQKLGQLAGRGIGAAGSMVKKGIGAAGGMIKNKMMQRESSAYDRITNMLLEARVDMFIQDRLDESRVDELNKATMKRALAKGKERVAAAHRASNTGGDSRMGSKSGPTASSQAAKRPQLMMAKIKGRLSGNKKQQAADRGRAQYTATSTNQAGRDARIKQRGMERRATEKISKVKS